MNICLLSKMFPPTAGGSAMYAYEIANALAARGHDVDVYTQTVADEERSVPVHDDVTVYTLAKARRYLVTFETLYYSFRARYAVEFGEYDVIHGTLMPASTVGLADRLRIDVPIILTSHSFAPSMIKAYDTESVADYLLKYVFQPTNIVLDNVAARGASKVIAISSEMAEQLTNWYRLPESHITTVPHGVDTGEFRPQQEEHPAVSEDRPTLLFVGRLITQKRVDLAINALAETSHTDVELLIAGSGRSKQRLSELAAERGVSDRVEFLGFVKEDLPILYSSVDTLLFTSKYEGFGLVFLEALASGTPVVGTPVGGIPDIVADGETGYVVPADPEAFARKIDHLADHPETLERMSEAARASVEHRTWDHVAAQVEDVYEQVCDERADKRGTRP